LGSNILFNFKKKGGYIIVVLFFYRINLLFFKNKAFKSAKLTASP